MAWSAYYKRTKGLYEPGSREPFKLSRTKIDLFMECPRCFYLDRRKGIPRPAGFPFNLNSAVDALLKKEFDIHRARKTQHPLMESYGVDAVPFAHDNMDQWRENFVGVQALHKPTNFLIFGAIDDAWVNPAGELIIVDYKATSKDGEVSLDAEWQDGYKRQMEVYQWLMRQNGFTVSDTGYFVYANGKKDREAFDGKLEFDVKLIPYEGKTEWIEKTLGEIKKCLESEAMPPHNSQCEQCGYIKEAAAFSAPVAPTSVAKKIAVPDAEAPPAPKRKRAKKAPPADQSTLF